MQHWGSPEPPHQLSCSSLREGLRMGPPRVIPKEEVMLGAHRRRAEGNELQDLPRALGFLWFAGRLQNEEGRQPSTKGAQRCTSRLQSASKGPLDATHLLELLLCPISPHLRSSAWAPRRQSGALQHQVPLHRAWTCWSRTRGWTSDTDTARTQGSSVLLKPGNVWAL